MTDNKTAAVQKITAVKGMNDILPPESALWEHFEATVRDVMQAYGYLNVRTPIVEKAALFVRGLGEVTDIVEKEMYTWDDRADKHGEFEHLSLRPESTAGVVRAVNEHNALYDGGKRLWYTGPMFRREKPQRGRYRQFHQVGIEALGYPGPDVDVEVIALAARIFKQLGITGLQLQINSIGQPAERRAHRAELIAHLDKHADRLDEDARRRLHTNPLRILDTKNPAMQEIVDTAPRLLDFLTIESRGHFDSVRGMLESLGMKTSINPRLVRGMDYYNLTVFEFVTTALGAQGTLCGGGRYDYLIEQIGGKPAPAVGWGMGVERVLEVMKDQGLGPRQATTDAYLIVQSESLRAQAMQLAEQLRDAGIAVVTHAGAASMKSQFKKADACGANLAVIVAEQEWAQGQVVVKRLRDAATTANQQVVAMGDLAASLRILGSGVK
jgi:histidyl-tRNA synthetase